MLFEANPIIMMRRDINTKANKIEVFYGTRYDLYDRLKNDSYVIEKDLYVRI
jgi:hypothetical protein